MPRLLRDRAASPRRCAATRTAAAPAPRAASAPPTSPPGGTGGDLGRHPAAGDVIARPAHRRDDEQQIGRRVGAPPAPHRASCAVARPSVAATEQSSAPIAWTGAAISNRRGNDRQSATSPDQCVDGTPGRCDRVQSLQPVRWRQDGAAGAAAGAAGAAAGAAAGGAAGAAAGAAAAGALRRRRSLRRCSRCRLTEPVAIAAGAGASAVAASAAPSRGWPALRRLVHHRRRRAGFDLYGRAAAGRSSTRSRPPCRCIRRTR